MIQQPVKLTMKHARAAGEVLAEAFSEYPLTVWFTPDAEERKRIQRHVYTRMVRYAMRYGWVIASSLRLEAVVVWVPSEKAEATWWRNTLCGNFSLPFVKGKGPGPRHAAYREISDTAHRRSVAGPHYYIRLLGVQPEHRNKGYSSLLMRAVSEQADREGRPCFLETQAERNVEIYRHLGYEVMEESRVPGGEVRSWAMLRRPAEKGK